LGEYDIKVLDTRWGDTPRNALDDENQKDKILIDRLINSVEECGRQPDVYVDVRIPNEFAQIGKFNIGITAGIETHAVSQPWLEGVNKMDLIIVPSEHSKMGFENSHYDKIQQLPDGQQQKIGELRLEKPMEVLFEGVDLDKFKKLESTDIKGKLVDDIDSLPEDSAFLLVGQWVKGNYGEDRKDIGRTLKLFYETFIGYRKKPALILKTNGANFSILDRKEILNRINSVKSMFPSNFDLPNVYLLHGNLTIDEMNLMYNHPKIKSLVSFTHGEGFGRPLLEATMAGLPVIASNWSGQLDFLDNNYSLLVKGSMGKVPESAVWENVIIPESEWFTIDEQDASSALEYSYKNQENVKEKSIELMKINRNKFSHKNMTKKLGEILNRHVVNQVPLTLPKLKKVEVGLPKLETV
jgi:glycosyltransferase involved in cell wall biosynthesis